MTATTVAPEPRSRRRPRRLVPVLVLGLDITYRTPYQRGTQRTGPSVAVVIEEGRE